MSACSCEFHMNAAKRKEIFASSADPSRTTSLRLSFMAEMSRRLRALKRDIQTSIVDRDCFGLNRTVGALSATPPSAYAFERDQNKIIKFMAWLKEQEAKGILEVTRQPGSRIGVEGAWTDVYIRRAYQQGIRRADAEMQRANIEYRGDVQFAFNAPVHADKVGVIYTRTYGDLQSVVEQMNAAVRRQIADGLTTGLAEGVSQGLAPATIARNLMQDVTNRVDAIGDVRARMIARTEVIRAHHVASINEYRRADVGMNVAVKVEWSAAASACPQCAALSGRIFTLDEIEPLIPLHPNCACVSIPVIVDIATNNGDGEEDQWPIAS